MSATTGRTAIEPVYLDLSPDPVFGLLHPVQGAVRRSAVLLCPPFGWAEACSYRARFEWAHHLAAGGHPTLRIDLPGTGDSGGDLQARNRVGTWTDAVTAGVELLRREGDGRVTVIGIALGGLHAMLALAAGARFEELVLWGTRANGRAWVRELRAMGQLEQSRMQEAGAAEPPPLPDGAVAAGGFVLHPEMRAALEAIDVSELDLPSGVLERALLLGRDGMAADDALGEALARAGAEVSLRSGPGFGAAVIGDLETVEVPRETFAQTSAWLDEAPAHEAAHAAAQASPPPAPAPALRVEVAGTVVEERPFVHEVDGGRLFGVVAQPDGPPDDLCVVLLNAGPQRRTGPNRMWVQSARRWAAQGVRSLRLDLDGIGDADGRPAGWREEAAFYEQHHVDHVKDVLARLRADGMARRFLLLGLCSGANWAFNVALDDESVTAALLINARALVWQPWLAGDRESRKLRKLASPQMWLRLLRGDVDPGVIRGVAQAALGRLARVFATAPRGLTRPEKPDEIGETLARLERQGTLLTFVFTDEEPLHEELAREGRLDGGRHLRVEHVRTGANAHALQPLWVQAEVHRIMDDALERALRQPGVR